jgi:hypothetical protein
MRLTVIASIGIALVGCSGTAVSNPSRSAQIDQSSAPGASRGAGVGSTDSPGDCSNAVTLTRHHDVPDLERILPASVAGRRLAIWSVDGPCWLGMATLGSGLDAKSLLGKFDSLSSEPPINLSDLGYAIAGRSDTTADPPYFVYAAKRPDAGNAIALTLVLMFGGASFHEPLVASDLGLYTEQTISGKDVFVGTPAMLDQTVHQRGQPYLYQTDTDLFLVITDDDVWAADALRQLP